MSVVSAASSPAVYTSPQANTPSPRPAPVDSDGDHDNSPRAASGSNGRKLNVVA